VKWPLLDGFEWARWMSRQVEAVIFDLDGLMVDSEPLARLAWEQVVQEYGRELDDHLYLQIIGRRLEDSSRLIQEGLNLPVSATDLARQKDAAWQAIWSRGLPPMPGLMALHKEIRRRHLPWAVATSSHRHYARRVLQQLGLLEQCSAIAAGDEVAHGKPAPDLYLLAAARLGVSARMCLALEDSAPGCQAAVTAGMTVAAVPGAHTTPAELGLAHYIFATLANVAANLDALMAGSNSLTIDN
jgi:HAD superfamily hydrolase (TIGR01509 family)